MLANGKRECENSLRKRFISRSRNNLNRFNGIFFFPYGKNILAFFSFTFEKG